MKRLRSLLFGVLATAPLAVFASVADLSLEPAVVADEGSEQQVAIDAARDSQPVIPDSEITGIAPAQCCWVFYHGKWWCAPC